MLLEVCVDCVPAAVSAQSTGADRVELCSCVNDGGITPSHGLIAAVCRALSATKVHVLIRPRPGDFLYSPDELQIMKHDVLHAASCGAHGVVLGMLTADGSIDTAQLLPFTELCAALGIELTFHRAFDVVKDPVKALDALLACGVRRVLSSGGQRSVMEGLEQLARLVAEGGSRISVMPGGGVTAENAATVARVTGCTELHGSFSSPVPSRMAYRHVPMLFDDGSRTMVDAAAVQRVRQALAAADGGMEVQGGLTAASDM